MAKTVGDLFIERLHDWGIRRIYGYPGDGINGVFGKQVKAAASTLAKGNPREGSVILNTAGQALASVLPGKD